MRRKKFLEPIALVDDTMSEKIKLLYDILETRKYDGNSAFNDFLDDIHLIEDDYIVTIQSTLKQLVILLECKPCHIWNNNFTKNMLQL